MVLRAIDVDEIGLVFGDVAADFAEVGKPGPGAHAAFENEVVVATAARLRGTFDKDAVPLAADRNVMPETDEFGGQPRHIGYLPAAAQVRVRNQNLEWLVGHRYWGSPPIWRRLLRAGPWLEPARAPPPAA